MNSSINKKIDWLIFLVITIYTSFYFINNSITSSLKIFSIICLTVLVFIFSSKIDKKSSKIQLNLLVFLILFNLSMLISTIHSYDPLKSIVVIIGVNIYITLFYFNGLRLSNDLKAFDVFNKIIILVITISVICALFIDPNLTFSQFNSTFMGRKRIYGLILHPNFLGGLCYVGCIAITIVYTLEKKKIKKVLYSIIFMFLIITLYFSDSRGGLYSLTIYLILYTFYFLHSNTKNTLWRILQNILFSIILITILINLLFNLDSVDVNQFSSGRLSNWTIIYENYIQKDMFSFIFGFGLSGLEYLQNKNIYTDNGYLVWMFEAGLINMIFILVIFLYLGFKNYSNIYFRRFTIPVLFSYLVYTSIENLLTSFGIIITFYCWSLLFVGINKKEINKSNE